MDKKNNKQISKIIGEEISRRFDDLILAIVSIVVSIYLIYYMATQLDNMAEFIADYFYLTVMMLMLIFGLYKLYRATSK